MNRQVRNAAGIAFAIVSVFVLGCQGVALTNKTNQFADPPGTTYAYDASRDTFIDAVTPWKYQLKVVRMNGVAAAGVTPSVIIDGTSHPMQIAGDWNGDTSLWYFDRPVACPSPKSSPSYTSGYSFSVSYVRPNMFVDAPPARIPAAGQYASRIVNMGCGFVPTPPYPNYGQSTGVIYDQNCWETGMGCVPTWKRTIVVNVNEWPGDKAFYESKLLLRNPEPQEATLTQLMLGPLGTDTTSYTLFEIVNTPQPIKLAACGGTAEITIRYKPGYSALPGYTLRDYSHQLILTSKVQWANTPNLGSGPFVWINYSVTLNPM